MATLANGTEKQKVVLLSNSKSSDMDWGNKHDPNARLYLDTPSKAHFVESGRLNGRLVNFDKDPNAGSKYIEATTRPDLLLYLPSTVLWRRGN